MPRKFRTVIPYYKLGVLYPPGSIVEIPDDERPSKTWVEVKDAAPAVEAPVEAPAVRRRRPADSDPAVT